MAETNMVVPAPLTWWERLAGAAGTAAVNRIEANVNDGGRPLPMMQPQMIAGMPRNMVLIGAGIFALLAVYLIARK